MEKELAKLWKEYKDWCEREQSAYMHRVGEEFGYALISRNKDYEPNFEGFMIYISTL